MPWFGVVAHPDDDLLFFNPDLAEAIRGNGPVTTVYVTAGQASGTGTTPGVRARGRQRGIMDAYAYTAGYTPAGDQSEWIGSLITIGGKQIEKYTLDDRVHLVWLGLPDGKLAALESGTPQLTVAITGGLGAPVYGYNRADVVNTLTTLINTYQPEHVRTQDPWPESRYTPLDHVDHVAAARMAGDAAVATDLSAVPYRCYSITAVPANLSLTVANDKLAIFDTYAAYDDDAAPYGWCERMLYRWPRGTQWVGRNSDGCLQVFTVQAGAVVTQWELTIGGSWSAPFVLGNTGGAVAPTLSVAYDTDGRMELFARRLSDHRIVCLWQNTPSGTWVSAWTSLGNHNAGQSNEAQMGYPVVSRHADGRLALFTKNGGGGVSMKSQTAPGSGWSAWSDLGGTDVQDGLAVVDDTSGRLELFAATTTGVLRWRQSVVNGAFTLDTTLPSLPPASPPTAIRQPNGQLLLVYRQAADIVVTSQSSVNGPWQSPTVVSGPGGHGQVAAAVFNSQIWLACRDGNGEVSVTTLDATGQTSGWVSYGGTCDVPALATINNVLHVFTGDPAYRSLSTGWVQL